jgi:protein phosphatase
MIEIGSAIDPGRVRRGKQNQDALCVQYPRSADSAPLLVIADGMGGYQGGALASQIVVECVCHAYREAERAYSSTERQAAPVDVLRQGVEDALRAMKIAAAEDEALAYMGSTLVAAVAGEKHITLLNVGDSRAYLISTAAVRQISYDHSLVGEQLRRNLITQAEARTHPRRNVLSMSISAKREQIDCFQGEFAWQPGDCLVLCSDGLWGPVNERQIRAAVLEYAPQQAADRLVALANANKGPDNIAVIVARLS